MLSDFFEEFVLQSAVKETDQYGGYSYNWRDDGKLMAAISTTSQNIVIDDNKIKVATGYVIAWQSSVDLHPGDTLMRKADGRRYRITSMSQDMTAPSVAFHHHKEVTAELVTDTEVRK